MLGGGLQSVFLGGSGLFSSPSNFNLSKFVILILYFENPFFLLLWNQASIWGQLSRGESGQLVSPNLFTQVFAIRNVMEFPCQNALFHRLPSSDPFSRVPHFPRTWLLLRFCAHSSVSTCATLCHFPSFATGAPPLSGGGIFQPLLRSGFAEMDDLGRTNTPANYVGHFPSNNNPPVEAWFSTARVSKSSLTPPY